MRIITVEGRQEPPGKVSWQRTAVFGVLAVALLLVLFALVVALFSLFQNPTILLAFILVYVVGALIIWKAVRHWNDVDNTKTILSRLTAFSFVLAIILTIIYIVMPLFVNAIDGLMGIQTSAPDCPSPPPPQDCISGPDSSCITDWSPPLCTINQSWLGAGVTLFLLYGIDVGFARFIGPRFLE